jgi:branched-chain amino acid transport system permease protein
MLAYLTAMSITAGIYALMALGVNLTWGMAGMVNLGLAGFFAVGGYTTALLTKSGVAIPVGIMAGGVAAAAVGAVVALITARLRADYLAIVTLGFSESVRIAASNEIWLTNGSDGIAGIPGPWRGVLPPLQFNLLFLSFVMAILLGAFWLMHRLGAAPFGRVLRAIRDDEDVAAVAGKHVLLFKVKAFAVGAAVLGVAGALYAHATSFIAPEIFAPLLTLNIILALVAGGVGNNSGAVLGAVLIVARAAVRHPR